MTPRPPNKPCPGCGKNIIPRTTPRCPTCAREHERKRGSRQQRGYTQAHVRERQRWAPHVAKGGFPCAKCGQPIPPNGPWHLGHTDDRTTWTGPEHAHCNLEDAGKRSHPTP